MRFPGRGFFVRERIGRKICWCGFLEEVSSSVKELEVKFVGFLEEVS